MNAIPDIGLIDRFGGPGPRYTSYPTADRFTTSHSAQDALQALGSARRDRPLSLYVHIPFCESVCYYCACNKIVTRQHDRATPYLDMLEREIDLTAQALGPTHQATQVHFGGGTPTFLSDSELARVVAALRRRFDIPSSAEMSIEIDPRTVDAQRLSVLRRLGFDRISFGVQDLDPDVQQAVHRIQSEEQIAALIEDARRLKFASINVDLIYGLPRQTSEGFAKTVARIATLAPDRIALYGYAHLPQRFKPQRRIVDADLPSSAQRVLMLRDAIAAFGAAGYAYVGMDHFALPTDPLARALRDGTLTRSFQGYGTHPGGDLIGFGVSAISTVGDTHHQNAKDIVSYQSILAEGRLPIERGLALSMDDCVRRDAIAALMCQGALDLQTLGRRHAIDAVAYFSREWARLDELCDVGLIEKSPERVRVTPIGRALLRAVASVFDAHLPSTPRERYSKVG